MNKIVSRELRIKESIFAPCEGIFWIINNNLIASMEQTDTTGNRSTTLEHSKIWDVIKNNYVVNGNVVRYDYFPRGRVMVNPKYKDGIFTHYDIFIYIDDCINRDDIVSDIKYEFCLTGENCNIRYIGADGGITENHYKCHDCRQEDN